jgi:catechol 2,3-dioxygenase-like lactoylglutathione lyase family enzyme
MSIGIIELSHVNVTVPAAVEEAAKHFYGVVLGLRQIPKPEGTRKNLGAWFELPGRELHLSIEDGVDNQASSRHVCYVVADLNQAEVHFRNCGVTVIPDPRPIEGSPRFYVRDPGRNLIEIAQNQSRSLES